MSLDAKLKSDYNKIGKMKSPTPRMLPIRLNVRGIPIRQTETRSCKRCKRNALVYAVETAKRIQLFILF